MKSLLAALILCAFPFALAQKDAAAPAKPADANAAIAAFLKVHNDARAAVGAPPLKWSPKLAAHAQEWADNIAKRTTLEHRPAGSPYGENIFAGTDGMTPTDAATAWLGGKKDYKGGAITAEGIPASGYYTQMVWKESTEVGFGIARGGGEVYIVANYNPPGNFVGAKPY